MFKPGNRINLHIRGSVEPIPGFISSEAIIDNYERQNGSVVRTTLFEVVTFRTVPQGRPGAGLTSYRRTVESLSFLSLRREPVAGLDDLTADAIEDLIAASITRFQNGAAVSA